MAHKAKSRWGCHLWRDWEQILFPSRNPLSVCHYHENVHFLAQSLSQRSPCQEITCFFWNSLPAFCLRAIHSRRWDRIFTGWDYLSGWQNQHCNDSSYCHCFSLAIKGVTLLHSSRGNSNGTMWYSCSTKSTVGKSRPWAGSGWATWLHGVWSVVFVKSICIYYDHQQNHCPSSAYYCFLPLLQVHKYRGEGLLLKKLSQIFWDLIMTTSSKCLDLPCLWESCCYIWNSSEILFGCLESAHIMCQAARGAQESWDLFLTYRVILAQKFQNIQKGVWSPFWMFCTFFWSSQCQNHMCGIVSPGHSSSGCHRALRQ